MYVLISQSSNVIYCSEGPTFKKPVLASLAGVQPRWIQGIRSGDGVGEDQETTA